MTLTMRQLGRFLADNGLEMRASVRRGKHRVSLIEATGNAYTAEAESLPDAVADAVERWALSAPRARAQA